MLRRISGLTAERLHRRNNSRMTDVPTPVESGSAGTQQAAPKGQPLPAVAGVLPQYAMTTAVQGIASDRSHSLGGANSAALISGYATMMHAELQATKEELLEVRGELKDTRQLLADERTRVEVLRSRRRSGGQIEKFQLLGVTVGGFLFTTAIEVAQSGAVKLGWGIGAAASILILVSWVWSFRGEA